jgi:hypothetical protein
MESLKQTEMLTDESSEIYTSFSDLPDDYAKIISKHLPESNQEKLSD